MIVFDNVTKYYKSNVGLEKVSVRINKGDFVFLVGPSGAGKSTFIKLILKEIDATSSGPDPAEKYRDRVPGFPSSAEEDRL